MYSQKTHYNWMKHILYFVTLWMKNNFNTASDQTTAVFLKILMCNNSFECRYLMCDFIFHWSNFMKLQLINDVLVLFSKVSSPYQLEAGISQYTSRQYVHDSSRDQMGIKISRQISMPTLTHNNYLPIKLLCCKVNKNRINIKIQENDQ